jgi:hypothetical protein
MSSFHEIATKPASERGFMGGGGGATPLLPPPTGQFNSNSTKTTVHCSSDSSMHLTDVHVNNDISLGLLFFVFPWLRWREEWFSKYGLARD